MLEPMSDDRPSAELIEWLRAQRGKRAVFRETGYVIPVTIEDIDCGSSLQIFLKPVDGIIVGRMELPEAADGFSAGVAWDHFSATPERCSASVQGAAWGIKLDEALCAQVVQLVRQHTDMNRMELFRLASGMVDEVWCGLDRL